MKMKNLKKYIWGLLLIAVTFAIWAYSPEGGLGVTMATGLLGITYNPSNKCRRGSLKAIWIGQVAGVTSLTLISSKHGYQAVVQASPTLGGFKKYTFEPNKAFAKFTSKENENGTPTYDWEVQIYEPKITPALLLEGSQLGAMCGVVVIAEFYDQVDVADGVTTKQTLKLVFGYDEDILATLGGKVGVSGESGEKMEDANGLTCVIKGNQSEMPYYFDTLLSSPSPYTIPIT